MDMNKILIIVALLVIAALSLNTCRLSGRFENQTSTLDSLTLANQKMETIINQQGDTINKQEVIIVNSTDQLNKLTDTIFDLKRKDRKNRETIAYYKGISKVEVKVDVPYLDTLAIKKFGDSLTKQCSTVIQYMRDSMITVPRTAAISNDTLSAKLTVSKQGVKIDSLSMIDTLNLRFVEHKRFLKRPTIELQYFHSNPLFKSEKVTSVFYKPKKKSNLLSKALLIAAGIFVGTRL